MSLNANNPMIISVQNNSIFAFFNQLGGIWLWLAIAVITFASIVFRKIVFSFFQRIFKQISDQKKRKFNLQVMLPTETIRIVPIPGQSRWSYGTYKKGNKTVDIIHAAVHVYVTNITKGGILIASTYMKKPKSEATIPLIQEPAPRRHYWGAYSIPSRELSELKASYFLEKKFGKKGNDITGNVVFTDQLGNEHLVKDVIFQYAG